MSNPNVIINRQKYIGGSDLPYILGYGTKYDKSPYQFALEKAGIIPNKFKGNEFTKYGQLMELMIRDYINAKYNCNYHEDTIIDTKRDYRGNTDGIDNDAEIPIIEIKTFGKELDVEYYTPQCQFYMEVFDKQAVRLIGYQRPEDFYLGVDYELENDDSYFNLEFNPDRIVEVIIKRDKDIWDKINKLIIDFKNGVGYLQENSDSYSEEEFNKLFYGSDIMVLANNISAIETKLSGYKDIERQYKNDKEKIYNLFEEKGILAFETANLKITRVNPTSYDTVFIDSVRLEAEHKDIYNEYKIIKTTNKKGYVLITNKKVSEE